MLPTVCSSATVGKNSAGVSFTLNSVLHTEVPARKTEGSQAEKQQLHSAVRCDEDVFFFHSQWWVAQSCWTLLVNDVHYNLQSLNNTLQSHAQRQRKEPRKRKKKYLHLVLEFLLFLTYVVLTFGVWFGVVSCCGLTCYFFFLLRRERLTSHTFC